MRQTQNSRRVSSDASRPLSENQKSRTMSGVVSFRLKVVMPRLFRFRAMLRIHIKDATAMASGVTPPGGGRSCAEGPTREH